MMQHQKHQVLYHLLEGRWSLDFQVFTDMSVNAVCREKDALWQKTDALEFEQKLREEETERDVNYCLGCRSQFSWWLRKYNCRSDLMYCV